jgi:hypothetical protein
MAIPWTYLGALAATLVAAITTATALVLWRTRHDRIHHWRDT